MSLEVSKSHVIRIFGSPDKWIAYTGSEWVDDKGNPFQLRLLSDSAKQDFRGADAEQKIALLGFGGRFKKPEPVKPEPVKPVVPATKSFNKPVEN